MKIISINKAAKFNYEIQKTFEAGIILKGSEIKSIRSNHSVQIKESYGYLKKGEIFLLNLHIPEYKMSAMNNHEPTQSRKLLLKKREIHEIEKYIREKRYTLVPLKIFFKNQYVKIEIGLAKGKKLHDKRQTIKNRDIEREIQKNKKREK